MQNNALLRFKKIFEGIKYRDTLKKPLKSKNRASHSSGPAKSRLTAIRTGVWLKSEVNSRNNVLIIVNLILSFAITKDKSDRVIHNIVMGAGLKTLISFVVVELPLFQ